jgi:hypothetical protein
MPRKKQNNRQEREGRNQVATADNLAFFPGVLAPAQRSLFGAVVSHGKEP